MDEVRVAADGPTALMHDLCTYLVAVSIAKELFT
jgi:hypothetical protein